MLQFSQEWYQKFGLDRILIKFNFFLEFSVSFFAFDKQFYRKKKVFENRLKFVLFFTMNSRKSSQMKHLKFSTTLKQVVYNIIIAIKNNFYVFTPISTT